MDGQYNHPPNQAVRGGYYYLVKHRCRFGIRGRDSRRSYTGRGLLQSRDRLSPGALMRRPSLLAVAALLSAAVPAFAGTTYVKAGRLLDVESGRLLPDQAIVIEDARITAIGPIAATPVPAE